MKSSVYILLLFVIGMSCTSENAPDCFQTAGRTVTQTVPVPDFTRILVRPNVQVILKQDSLTSVTIETGDNLLKEVTAVVDGDRLILSNTNDCNFVREFNQTIIFITAPNVTEIRSATQFDIASDGILTYPSLAIISEDFNEDEGTTTGTFTLTIANEKLSVVGNSMASFFISGATENLNVNFASGIGRFEGADLVATNVTLFHRGTNKMIVNPQSSLKGELRSTGDLISINRPPVVEVTEFFKGKLIFQE